MVPVQIGGAMLPDRRQEVEIDIEKTCATIQFFQRKFEELRANYEAQINSQNPFEQIDIELSLYVEKDALEGALQRSPSPDLQEPLPEGELHDRCLTRRNLQRARRQVMKDFLAFVQDKLAQFQPK